MDRMVDEEDRLKKYIRDHNIAAEHLHFDRSLHTVEDTVRVTGFDVDLITKSMIHKDFNNRTIVGIVPARFRVSTSRLGNVLNLPPPVMVSPEEAYGRTGYPVGGMPCFGYPAIVIMDPWITRNPFIYTGGGSENSLVRITPQEVIRVTDAIVRSRIRGKKSYTRT